MTASKNMLPKATPEDRKRLVEIFELCTPFRVKYIAPSKSIMHTHMLKNSYGNGGISFNQAYTLKNALDGFLSANGHIYQTKINPKTVQALYDALAPLRDLIRWKENKIQLFSSPLLKSLSQEHNIIKTIKKLHPSEEALSTIDALALGNQVRENRVISAKAAHRINTLSKTLQNKFNATYTALNTTPNPGAPTTDRNTPSNQL